MQSSVINLLPLAAAEAQLLLWLTCDDSKTHFKAVWIFPQKYASSVGINKPIRGARGAFKRHEKSKGQCPTHKPLPTNLILSKDLLGTNLTRKIVIWPKFSTAWPERHYLK